MVSRLEYASLQNPIAIAEFNHLRRVDAATHFIIQRLRQFGFIILMLLSLGALVMSFYLIITDTRPGQLLSQPTLGRVTSTLAFWTITAIATVHVVTITRTLGMAADSVRREKLVGTWDNLLLTNVNARQLVLGKWWAVVCKVWKDYVRLAALRVGITIAIGVVYLSSYPQAANVVLIPGGQPSAMPLLDGLLACVFVVAFTLVNGLFTAAAGVTGSFLSRVHNPGLLTAYTIRLTAVFVPIIILFSPIFYLLITVGTPFHLEEYGGYSIPAMWAQLTLLDNGTLLSSVLANPRDDATYPLVPVAIITLLTYLLLTLALLQAGTWIARKQGASL